MCTYCNNRRTITDTISAGSHFLIWDTSNGDWREISDATLLAYMQSNLTFSATGISYNTQQVSPTATGFSVQITDGPDSIHLILTPLAGYAAGTIVFPAFGNLVDKQEILVNCTQVVTTLTIDENGANGAVGFPTTLAANDFFRGKYDATTQTWYRVG